MRSEAETRLLRKVSDALGRIGLPTDALVVVAVSGGADSVALLRAMLSLRAQFGYHLMAAHLNHGLRGDESDRDEAFVRALCDRLGVDAETGRAEGLEPGMPNLEERAREERHAFLADVARRRGAQCIALAHQADDQAETVMLRLLRGAGAAGLAAMDERGPARIIRPILAVSRAEVLEYLAAVRETFVSDSTNESPLILRNRVRNELLPALERDYAPGLSRRLRELSAEMRELDDFVRMTAREEMSRRLGDDGALDLVGLERLHPALQAVLVRLFIEIRVGSLRAIDRSHIEAVRRLCLHGPINGSLDLPRGIRVERQYGRLMLRPARPAVSGSFRVSLAPTGTTMLADAGFAFEASQLLATEAPFPANKWEAVFDLGEFSNGLLVRNFMAGDRIQPLGMHGRRKVKDIFIDARIPRSERTTFPIVEHDGEIAWLPGLVRGGKALVGKTTKVVLRVIARRLVETPLRTMP